MSSAESLSELVRRIIDSDPELRQCIERGVVNYSEVARRIKPAVEEVIGGQVSIDAVKTAVMRYARRLRGKSEQRSRLVKVLAESSLELRTDVAVATLKLTALEKIANRVSSLLGSARLLLLLQSLTTVTVIASSDAMRDILSQIPRSDVLDYQESQTAIIIVSPREVITTPGFIAYVAELLASNGINISQIESVYTDTVIVLSRQDALKAFTLLDQAIRMARRMLHEA